MTSRAASLERAMDIRAGVRETTRMLEPGRARERLVRTLNAAFAEGLLSEQTHSHRLGLVFGPRVIEPRGVTVNGVRVGRCQLRPGDRVGLGLQLVDID
jgi:hypothetical protein